MRASKRLTTTKTRPLLPARTTKKKMGRRIPRTRKPRIPQSLVARLLRRRGTRAVSCPRRRVLMRLKETTMWSRDGIRRTTDRAIPGQIEALS